LTAEWVSDDVVEVAEKPFDAWVLEEENHCLRAEEDAVPPKAGIAKFVRRALGASSFNPSGRSRGESRPSNSQNIFGQGA